MQWSSYLIVCGLTLEEQFNGVYNKVLYALFLTVYKESHKILYAKAQALNRGLIIDFHSHSATQKHC